MFSSLFVVSNFAQQISERICMKFSGKVGNGLSRSLALVPFDRPYMISY